MKVLGVLMLLAVGLLVAAFFVWPFGGSHGHIDELLVVTVRVVDVETGQPLDGATVATVRHRNMLERDYLERRIEEALAFAAEDPEGAWQRARMVCAVKTAGETETTIRSAAYVTRYWRGSTLTGKEVFLPQVLLVEHPRFGRSIVPIDPETPVAAGDVADTWRMDLGTVRVPR